MSTKNNVFGVHSDKVHEFELVALAQMYTFLIHSDSNHFTYDLFISLSLVGLSSVVALRVCISLLFIAGSIAGHGYLLAPTILAEFHFSCILSSLNFIFVGFCLHLHAVVWVAYFAGLVY